MKYLKMSFDDQLSRCFDSLYSVVVSNSQITVKSNVIVKKSYWFEPKHSEFADLKFGYFECNELQDCSIENRKFLKDLMLSQG